MGSSSLLTLVGVFGGAIAAIAVALLIFLFQILRDRSISRYDDVEKRAEISDMRESFERRIYELNMELMSTRQRWEDVNHLILSSQQKQPDEPSPISLSPFLRDLGLQEDDLEIDSRLILVLTPFNDREQLTFEVIKDVCTNAGFRCVRGDEEHASGDVLTHILKLIVKSQYVIANIGSRNPNVFYELGVAQALGKPSILVARRMQEVPFDIQAKRILVYENREELRKTLPSTLLRLAVK